ncbi:PEP-CTERM sorting domain-containing protein [Vibrio japonicus]|uniref:PEP-CTERM sorting domain-containing protein n=1 Tax=Vibrio japonicus TaxID=1824638 RepID=A0ABY5LMP3_9VIBR|nr:PEP-CTERM sorting domain-containing protein [Vibrio japonicus]UUM32711.1 PEP-CTERM sorting domain-containing protein [Vibrio japonicus]
MLKGKLFLPMVASCVLLATNTHAGLLVDKIQSGDALYSLSSVVQTTFDNDYVDPTKIFGWMGANLFFDGNNEGSYDLNFTYLGSESSIWSRNVLFESNGRRASTILTEADSFNRTETETFTHQDNEALPFGFSRCTIFGCSSTVLNGVNNYDEPSFFFGFYGEDEYHLDFSTAYLFYDDGGARSDADFDDFVVSLTVGEAATPFAVAVPEPETLASLWLGLLGVGFLRYQRAKNRKMECDNSI